MSHVELLSTIVQPLQSTNEVGIYSSPDFMLNPNLVLITVHPSIPFREKSKLFAL
jgi:hypothetical protein